MPKDLVDNYDKSQYGEADTETSVNKPRHLVFVDHYATPPGIPGILRQHEFAIELKKHGWETTIVNSGFGHGTLDFFKPVSLKNPILEESLDGVRYRTVYTTPYSKNDIRRYLNNLSYFVTSQLRGFRDCKPDVIIGVNPHLLGALAGWLMAKRYRVPFVFEVHDLWPDSLVQLGLQNKPTISVLEKLESFLYQRADAIIAVADGIAEGIREKSNSDKPLLLLPSGADVEPAMNPALRTKRRSELGWGNRFVVIWTGAHGPANNLDTIVDAARMLSQSETDEDILFVLVGDGSDKPRLKNVSRGLKNIQFLDPMPASEVPQILRLADAGVIVHSDTVAVRGTRPTKLTEYMAAGLPVVSNLQGETARLIEEARCGVTIPTMRADLLAEALKNMATGGSEVQTMGQHGIDFVNATHDRAMLATRLGQLLDQMLED